jgi:hypothetical protein
MVGTSTNSPAGMFELLFVNVDRYIGVDKMLKPACMVKVKMTHNYRFNIFDVVASCFNCGREFLFLRILGSREDIGYWSRPCLTYNSGY